MRICEQSRRHRERRKLLQARLFQFRQRLRDGTYVVCLDLRGRSEGTILQGDDPRSALGNVTGNIRELGKREPATARYPFMELRTILHSTPDARGA
jgi:hypothetical protein